MNPRLNASGCRDPVAFEAIGRVIRDEKKKRKPTPPKVYICSPFRGDIKKNTENVIRYCRFAVKQGVFPIAPHAYLPLFMDDYNPAERELALSFGMRLLGGCKQLWVFGERISDGMFKEIKAARKRGTTVRYFNESMEEISYG
jgi:hypothetical protein